MQITDYTPDNDENTLYILDTRMSILDLIERVKDYFGQDVNLDTLNIRSEKIHTRCIYYDLHDSSDWDDYIVIERDTRVC